MKTLKSLMFGLVALALLVTAQPAAADYLPGQDGPKSEHGIERTLDYLAIGQFVPSRLEFRKLSSDPVDDLITVAKTSHYSVVLRARAVQSLALYKTDERAVEAVDTMMTRFNPGHRLFGPTLVAYAAVHGESVAEAVAPYAEHPKKSVRMAAVVALGRFCGQAGYDMLTHLVHDEQDSEVLARIKQYVG